MKDNDPSGIDRNKGVSDLPMLDEILEIAPGLEANWPAERAAFPPGTLLNDGTEAGGGEGGGSEGEPEGEPEGGGEEESFIDSFDLDSVDPAARPAVEALQKDWQGKYTQKRQADRDEVAGARREAEESQALIEGLRDPNTMPHYLRLLGVDLSNPQTLELLGISGGGQGDPDEELLALLDEDDDDDVTKRVAAIESERAEERQANETAAMEQALDDLADQELERIEQAWGRELDPDEDVFLRHRAESTPGVDGLPDYEAAAETLKAFLGRREQDWAKRRSEPGRGNTGGRPGGKALDMQSEDDRIAAGAAAAERAMASDD